MEVVALGALTTGRIATVDERGSVTRAEVTLGWRVHTLDRWIDPGARVRIVYRVRLMRAQPLTAIGFQEQKLASGPALGDQLEKCSAFFG